MEPYDRHEHVRVEPGYEERVVHDPAAEERQMLVKVTQLIWLGAAVLEVLILIRVGLRLIGANPASPFAGLVYGITELFLFPFYGLTVSPTISGAPTPAGMVLDIPAIIAMPIYLLLFWVAIRVLWLLFERPISRSVSTYHQDPVVNRRVVVERHEPVVEEHVVVEEPVVEERVVYEEPIRRDGRVIRHKRVIREDLD